MVSLGVASCGNSLATMTSREAHPEVGLCFSCWGLLLPGAISCHRSAVICQHSCFSTRNHHVLTASSLARPQADRPLGSSPPAQRRIPGSRSGGERAARVASQSDSSAFPARSAPAPKRGAPAHERRRQRANMLSAVVYVVASLLFIAILLLNSPGTSPSRSLQAGAGGKRGSADDTRLLKPAAPPPVNRSGATVVLRELQAARGSQLQDRLLRCRVVEAHAHDANAFSQGLEFLAGRLIESTGIVSSLREVEVKTGAHCTCTSARARTHTSVAGTDCTRTRTRKGVGACTHATVRPGM